MLEPRYLLISFVLVKMVQIKPIKRSRNVCLHVANPDVPSLINDGKKIHILCHFEVKYSGLLTVCGNFTAEDEEVKLSPFFYIKLFFIDPLVL